MNPARDEILAALRRALGRGALDEARQRKIDARLAAPAAAVHIERAGDPAARFTAKLQAAAGTVERVPSAAALPRAVIEYLRHHALPLSLALAPDPTLADIPWPSGLQIEPAGARPQSQVGLTAAFAAVAETGSLVLLSGPTSPTALNFLPEFHVVVLYVEQIVPCIEDLWPRLRARPGGMPRAVNFITGPSRTADVEQTLQLGAHGPRRLHVVLVEA